MHCQLGRNVEADIDDVVVKTREVAGFISDLAKTFDNLWKFKIKLNPDKWTFDVPQLNYSSIWSSIVVLTLTQRRCWLSLK
jgi:hypothetical protein